MLRVAHDRPRHSPSGSSPHPLHDGGFEPMNRPVRTALLACLALALGCAAGAAAASAGPAPILDRELFFGNPEIAGGPALPRRPVHGLPQAVERHPQHLGQEDGRALRGGPPGDRRDEAAHPGLLLDPRQPSDPLREGQRRGRELQRLGCRPRRPEGRGQGRPALAEPHRRQEGACVHLRGPEEGPRHHLRRPQRPRRRLARPLPPQALVGTARPAAQEHRPDLGLGVRPGRHAAARHPHRRER